MVQADLSATINMTVEFAVKDSEYGKLHEVGAKAAPKSIERATEVIETKQVSN
jgi:hypothetical protein